MLLGKSARPGLAAVRPQGVIPPSITFFDEDEAIDAHRIRRHVDWLVDAGVDGLLGIGTCGEFASLDLAEREGLAELLVESSAGRVPVYIGVMSTSTRTAIRLARQAEAVGAAGIVSVAPYYSSPPEREVLTYFRDVAAAVAIPLIVYNNPPASGTSLSVPTLAKLAVDGVAAGIKDSHGDASRVHDLRLLCPPETAILYGEDYGSFEAILAGADGWTAGVANFMPRHAVGLWRLARSGDLDATRAHWARILPLINMTSNKVMFGRPDERADFIQIYKAALDIMGMAGGASRQPLLPLAADDLRYLRGLVSELELNRYVA